MQPCSFLVLRALNTLYIHSIFAAVDMCFYEVHKTDQTDPAY